jgi:nucleoside-diphosphate-sugar epimerase
MYGNGAQLRSVLYVADAVSALLAAALAPASGQVWFAANAQSISVRALAERIVAVFGSGRVEQVEWPAARERIDVGDVVIDSSKLRSELGWQPQYALNAGLAATAAFFRQP